MKYLLIISLLFISVTSISQDCKNYYFLQNNKTIEMFIYNKKGDIAGKQIYTVSDYKNSGGTSSATVNTELLDKNGKSTAKSISTVKCTAGIMMMDMKLSMPQGQEYNTVDAKAENVYLEYPAAMNTGDNLKDGHMQIDMDNKGMKQTLTLDVTDRKVGVKEKVYTPAGDFDCYKITNSTKMKIKTMGIGIPINMDVTEWFAPGFGIVISQSKYGSTRLNSIK